MAGNTAAAGDNVTSEVAEGPAEGSRVWLVTSVAGSKNVGRTVGAGTEMQKGGGGGRRGWGNTDVGGRNRACRREGGDRREGGINWGGGGCGDVIHSGEMVGRGQRRWKKLAKADGSRVNGLGDGGRRDGKWW